jgi:hypothetical protein
MPRYFTIDEANALIPQVRPRLEECSRIAAELGPLQQSLSRASRLSRGNGHGDEGAIGAQAQRARQLTETLQQQLAAIQALGIEVKDIERGLIDFRHKRDGLDVYLCWMLGEGDIAWWHPVETGFAGRQPL